jgi:hypothetical protein
MRNRYDYSNRFHWAQYHIIFDQTSEMFDEYAIHLKNDGVPKTRFVLLSPGFLKRARDALKVFFILRLPSICG